MLIPRNEGSNFTSGKNANAFVRCFLSSAKQQGVIPFHYANPIHQVNPTHYANPEERGI